MARNPALENAPLEDLVDELERRSLGALIYLWLGVENNRVKCRSVAKGPLNIQVFMRAELEENLKAAIQKRNRPLHKTADDDEPPATEGMTPIGGFNL